MSFALLRGLAHADLYVSMPVMFFRVHSTVSEEHSPRMPFVFFGYSTENVAKSSRDL